jgi:hypothetical protein
MSRPALVVVLVAASACGHGLHPAPADPIDDPAVLLDRMSARRAALPPISATARVENYSKEGVAKGRVTVLADVAGRLRVDAWSPSDDLLAALYADTSSFTYFERGAPECLGGGSCRANVDRFLPIGLDLLDACGALQGVPPVRPAASPWRVSFDRRVGAYRVESALAGGGSQALWVEDDGLPVRAEYADANGREYRMECLEFKGAGPARRPWRIRFVDGAGGRDVTFRFRSIDAADAPGDEWRLECPKGLAVKQLPCEAP